MNKTIITIATLLAVSVFSSFAQDVTKESFTPFYTREQAPHLENVLPDPPALNSTRFMDDWAMYQWGKSIRKTERGQQAVADAGIGAAYFMDRFSPAVGRKLSPETHPHLYRLLYRAHLTEQQAGASAKKHFARVRPYQQFGEQTAVPGHEHPTDFTSYPSGHTHASWLAGLILTTLDPEHTEEIMKVAYELGQSRVIVGFHYQSDIEAGRVAGSITFARLCAEPEFQKMLKLAMKEYSFAKFSIAQVEPLVKILPSDSVFVDVPDTIFVARGENAAFQFVLTAPFDVEALAASVNAPGLGDVKVGWVHDVHNEHPTHDADDMITDPDNNYPDPIIDDSDEFLKAGGHKTLWVDVAVPRGAGEGVHVCNLAVEGTVGGEKVLTRKDFRIKVYPVDLPEEQSLNVVNWYTPSTIYRMNGGKHVDHMSDRYFELLQKVAEIGAAYGQNCWKIQERPNIFLNADSTDFEISFDGFDRSVQMFIDHGNLKTFHNSAVGYRFPGLDWREGHSFSLYYVEDKQLKRQDVTYDDPRLKHYIDRYYSKLEAHLREKGWLDICLQHIADEPAEPGTKSQISWSAVAGMVKAAAPGMRTVDASAEIVENQDVSVILLGPNIETLPPVPDGAQRWLYTCTGPQGNYANRFIQLPLLKTRILHWINYRYNEVGYLHWGFNYWNHAVDPMTDVTPTENWPGGDPFIIYPGYEKVYPSIRLNAMRDGIRDYDLLKMVEAKDPGKAMEFCRSIILGPDSYNMDIKHFYSVRKQMLEFLSGK